MGAEAPTYFWPAVVFLAIVGIDISVKLGIMKAIIHAYGSGVSPSSPTAPTFMHMVVFMGIDIYMELTILRNHSNMHTA